MHSHTDSHEGSPKSYVFPIIAKITNPLATDYWSCSTPAGRYAFGNLPFKIFKNTICTSRFRFNKIERLKIRRKLGL